MKNLTQSEADNLLSAWLALEALSPQKFLNPVDLAKGDPTAVDMLKGKWLPWENDGEKAKPRTELSYQIVIGTIDFKKTVDMLLKKYTTDGFIEEKSASGEAIIGVIVVDKDGCPTSLGFSSFAWGINKALQGELKDLPKWLGVESKVFEQFREKILKTDEKGKYLPLTRSEIDQAYDYLTVLFRIPENLVINKQFAIRTYEPLSKEKSGPEPLLLNSFYLQDLAEAKYLISKAQVPENLRRYIGIDIPKKRYNILDDHNRNLFENVLAPKNTPLARWPGKGKRPLVLLQQAAMNIAQSELKHGGILAVNGPPGTGKTTLLRDAFAAIITKRAEALLKFDDPATAFIDTGKKVAVGKSWLKLYKIDESLKGFEILIASSNNKAVENISAEFPSLASIDNDAEELRYFSNLAEELLGMKSWGLVAAVLGNSSNRSRFSKTFWWDNDFGLAAYLAEAAGIPQTIDARDEKTGRMIERPPKIVLGNDPPRSHHEALKRWKEAKKRFINTLNDCQKQLNELEDVRQDALSFEKLISELNLEPEILEELNLEELILEHERLKPVGILRFFSRLKWKNKQEKLRIIGRLQKKLRGSSKRLGAHIITKEFFEKNHADKNQTSPWCDSTTQILRDRVFIESIKLSKAFIDAAAKPLRNNLGILMRIFSKQLNRQGDLKKELEGENANTPILQFFADLWTSFFLVVPGVSTTFASLSRMFGYLPQNYLGWLIIDEAGQATPQAAVGAMMKTKRAIITGDPLQIEPVVTLPPALTEAIFHEFGVDANRFNAPKASVQTLADSATSYYAEFSNKHGSRAVGFPLLVHRRCSEPMFTISNVIAYDRLMVKAKNQQNSLIRNCLGHSVWFDVRGQANDKWCPEEGEKVIEILKKLKSNRVFPDLYIISPFKIVAYSLRNLLIASGVMDGWFDVNSNRWIRENIGTVHTVQGREADSVILVLGAPAQDQNGARGWAGSTPNLLNVAVTRAKENIYVIGNKELWKTAGVFRELHDRIEHEVA